ncbi:MAG: hypothetical protein GY725_11075 [bacterium]|nr:hypothetical protein [bacterium]
MIRSTERILTTHAGSLPRSAELNRLLVAQSRGEEIDAVALLKEVESSTRRVIAAQHDSGVDIGGNGEQARQAFYTYIADRLTGFIAAPDCPGEPPPKDLVAFPDLLKISPLREFVEEGVKETPYKIATEVRHAGLEPIETECAQFKRISGEERKQFVEPFMTAPSPGVIGISITNEFYDSKKDLLGAIATAMHEEYAYIVSQGFVLQLDCPDLGMAAAYEGVDVDEFLGSVEERIALINRALEGLPPDRVRLHLCWGNYEGPHTHDVPMRDLLPMVYRAKVGALLLPFANPRHAHEWRVLREMPPPDDLIVIAGVIDTTTNYVEHPEVVAERIEKVADALGDPTRVIAGTDCGFGTYAGVTQVVTGVVWEKLKALRAGADLATERLRR